MYDLIEYLKDPQCPGALTPEQAVTLLHASKSLHNFLEDQVIQAYDLVDKYFDDVRVKYVSENNITFKCSSHRRYEDYESWEETFPLADLLKPNFPDMYQAHKLKLEEEARLLREKQLQDQAEVIRQRDLAELARLTEKYGPLGKK